MPNILETERPQVDLTEIRESMKRSCRRRAARRRGYVVVAVTIGFIVMFAWKAVQRWL